MTSNNVKTINYEFLHSSLYNELVSNIRLRPNISEDFKYINNSVNSIVRDFFESKVGISLKSEFHSSSLNAVCGRTFEKGELLYQCKTCSVDETCVLCVDCFCLEDHKEHDYSYYLSRGDGGCCDCGETESWKKKLSCKLHGPGKSFLNERILSEKEISKIRLTIRELLTVMTTAFLEDEAGKLVDPSERETYQENAVFVLLNDEMHSFDYVIRMLQTYFNLSFEDAMSCARIVDESGFAPIKYGSNLTLARTVILVGRESGLHVDITSEHGFTHQLLAHFIFVTFKQIAEEFSFIRLILLQEFISFKIDNITCLQLFFQNEKKLTKQPRRTFHGLLTLGLQYQEVKDAVLECFINSLPKLTKFFPRDREKHLSILHFSVQILTVPSLARKAFENSFLNDICLSLSEVMRNLGPIELVSTLVSMMSYIFNDEWLVQTQLVVQDNGFYQSLFRCFEQICKIWIKERRDLEHVLYDETSILQREIAYTSILLRLTDAFAQTHEDPHALFFAIKETCSVIEKVYDSNPQEYQTFNRYSFIQPLFWFLGSLLIRQDTIEQRITDPFCSRNIIFSMAAKNVCILSDMEQGFWVRNGIDVASQVRFSFMNPFYHAVYYYPVILHGILVSNRTSFSNIISDIFGENDEGFKFVFPDRQNLRFIASFTKLLRILLGSNLGLSKDEAVQSAIIHALAKGPASYSSVEISVPNFISEHKSYETIFSRVSVMTNSNSLTESSKFLLRRDHAYLYNPYFWFYSNEDREKAADYMDSIMSRSKLGLIDPQHQPSSWRAVENIFLREHQFFSECVLKIISDESLSTLLEDAIIVLSILKKVQPNLKLSGDFEMSSLCSFVNHSIKPSNRNIAVNLINNSFIGLCLESSEQLSQKTSVESIKQKAEAKRREAMELIKQQREKFKSLQIEEFESTESNSSDGKIFTLSETGVCIYCQEPADNPNSVFGILCSPVHFSFRSGVSRSGIVSCFHVSHMACFSQCSSASKGRCPLCRAPSQLILPVFKICQGFPSGSVANSIIEKALDLSDDERHRLIVAGKKAIANFNFSEKQNAFLSLVTPAKGELKEIQNKIWKTRDIHSELIVNSIQGSALYGNPEYSNICRIGRALKLFALWQPFDKSSDQKSDDVFFDLLQNLRRLFWAWTAEDLFLYAFSFIKAALSPTSPVATVFFEGNAIIFRSFLSIWFDCEGIYEIPVERFLGAPITITSTKNPSLRPQRYKCSDSYLVKLQDELSSYFIKDLPKYCNFCDIRKERTVWYICLFCGVHFCSSERCKNSYVPHIEVCQKYYALYFVPMSCSCLLFFKDINNVAVRIPAPYINKHGEVDRDFRKGGPLFLSSFRYDILRRMWLAGHLEKLIPAETDNQDLFVLGDITMASDADEDEYDDEEFDEEDMEDAEFDGISVDDEIDNGESEERNSIEDV